MSYYLNLSFLPFNIDLKIISNKKKENITIHIYCSKPHHSEKISEQIVFMFFFVLIISAFCLKSTHQ